MNTIERIIVSIFVITVTAMVQLIKCKFAVFFKNFGTEGGLYGYQIDSTLNSKYSSEVSQYKRTQIKLLKALILAEVILAVIWIVIEIQI